MKKRVKKKIKETSKNSKSNSIEEYFRKVKKIYGNSSSFFKSIEKQDLVGVLRFFAIFYLIAFAISLIVSLIGTGLGIYNAELTIRTTLLDFINFFFSAAFSVFLVPLFVYGGLRILRIKKGYLNSFKPLAYGMVLNRGYMVLLLFVALALQLIFPVDMSAVTTLQTTQDPEIINTAIKSFFSQTNAIIMIIATAIIVLTATIHSLVFSIKGLAKFNKISKGKAIGSILIAIGLAFVSLILLGLLVGFLSNGLAPA